MEKLLMFLLVWRPIIRCISGKIPILTDLNSIGILVCLTIILILKKTRKKNIIKIFYFIMLTIISFISVEKIELAFKDPYWMIIAIMALMIASEINFIKNLNEYIKENYKLIKIQLYIINCILFISFFDKSAYSIKWGGGQYFKSYADGAHPLGFLMLLVIALALTLFKIKKERKIIYLIGIPIISLILTGARTPFVGMILLFLFKIKINKNWIIGGILSGVILKLTQTFWVTIPVVNKFFIQGAKGDITSGRAHFWENAINTFVNSSWIDKVIGQGFDYPYIMNYSLVGVEIWCHNDLINTLITIGLIGEIIYLSCIYEYLKFVKKFSVGINIFIFILYFFSIMLLNGFYNYTDLPITIVILTVYMFNEGECNENREEKNKCFNVCI